MTCGGGERTQTRFCIDAAENDDCHGLSEMTEACNIGVERNIYISVRHTVGEAEHSTRRNSSSVYARMNH